METHFYFSDIENPIYKKDYKNISSSLGTKIEFKKKIYYITEVETSYKHPCWALHQIVHAQLLKPGYYQSEENKIDPNPATITRIDTTNNSTKISTPV